MLRLTARCSNREHDRIGFRHDAYGGRESDTRSPAGEPPSVACGAIEVGEPPRSRPSAKHERLAGAQLGDHRRAIAALVQTKVCPTPFQPPTGRWTRRHEAGRVRIAGKPL